MNSKTSRSLKAEAEYWGSAVNTWHEEIKQSHYAQRMGLNYGNLDLEGKSVLDIGGGPVSMLLKSRNGGEMTVVDPCPFPDWVGARYKAHEIVWAEMLAEEYVMPDTRSDECWIYNVLQHVTDPALVVSNAKKAARTLRIFEWIDIPKDKTHPNVLTRELLNKWVGQDGHVEFGVNTAWGEAPAWAWYGVFTVGGTG